MDNEVAIIEQVNPVNALSVFLTKNGLDPYLDLVRNEIDAFVPDIKTSKGRKEITSMAANISRIKTAWDNLGKEEVGKLKEQPKIIDAERKRMRDLLDEWRDEVRKPLTDYEEAEKQRVQKIREEINWFSRFPHDLTINDCKELIAQRNAVEIDDFFEEFKQEAELEKLRSISVLESIMANLIENEEQEKQRKLKALEEQRLREERLIKEAEERAKLKAEQDAQQKIEDAKRQAWESEQRAKDAEMKAAKKAAEDIEKAENEKRIAEEERRKSDAHKEHRNTVMREARNCLVENGIDADMAQDVIDLISFGLIKHVQINY